MSQILNHTQRTTDNRVNHRAGEVVLSGEVHTSFLYSASPENIHITCKIWNQQLIFRNIYVDTNSYTHAITSSEKRGHEFE